MLKRAKICTFKFSPETAWFNFMSKSKGEVDTDKRKLMQNLNMSIRNQFISNPVL